MADPQSFTALVVETILRIPKGKVASYGQVAAIAGYPRMARHVSWVLNRDSRKYNLPWHRVVNASGGISLKGESGDLQRALLESEGVEFSPAGKVSMKLFGWLQG